MRNRNWIPGKIEELDLSALVTDDTRHRRERGELVRCNLAVYPSKICQQRGLSHRGKP